MQRSSSLGQLAAETTRPLRVRLTVVGLSVLVALAVIEAAGYFRSSTAASPFVYTLF
jgi:hypothetical protein